MEEKKEDEKQEVKTNEIINEEKNEQNNNQINIVNNNNINNKTESENFIDKSILNKSFPRNIQHIFQTFFVLKEDKSIFIMFQQLPKRPKQSSIN